VRDGDGVRPDPGRRLPGRGAYLCPDPECVRKAIRRRGFDRALKAPLSIQDNLINFID
jgi:predicted RNA-binding protein YlxR (DUF448 family)